MERKRTEESPSLMEILSKEIEKKAKDDPKSAERLLYLPPAENSVFYSSEETKKNKNISHKLKTATNGI